MRTTDATRACGDTAERYQALVERNLADPRFCRSLEAFAASDAFRSLPAGAREQMMAALDGVAAPREDDVARFFALACDDDFRQMAPSRREPQIEAALDDAACPSAAAIAEASGAARAKRPDGLPTMLSERVVDAVRELTSPPMLRALPEAFAPVRMAMFVMQALYETSRADEYGEAIAWEVTYGRAFVRTFEALGRGDDGDGAPAPPRPGSAEGAERARIVWANLEPAERAHLLVLRGADRLAFEHALARTIEARTMRGG